MKRHLNETLHREFLSGIAEETIKQKDEIHEQNMLIENGMIENEHGYCWLSDGVLHREDGPAVDYESQGYKAWWINGLRHREDGPAEEWIDQKYWWINGRQYSEEEYGHFLEKKALKEKLESNYGEKGFSKRSKI